MLQQKPDKKLDFYKSKFSEKTKAAAGILAKSPDGYFLLGQRAAYLKYYPHVWAVFGGTVNSGESFEQAAVREFGEETGYKGSFKNLHLIYTNTSSDGFVFKTYLATIESKFSPKLTGEHRKADWFKLEDFPANLHPGMKEMMHTVNKVDLLKEFTVADWRDQLGVITKKYDKERRSIKGPIEKNIKLKSFDIDSSTALWTLEPTYKSSVDAANLRGDPIRKTNYEVSCEFIDWKEWADNWKTMTLDEWKQIVSVCDVKWHCTCRGYHWQGIKYTLSRVDSAIHPTNIPDPIWRVKQNPMKAPYVCKHINSVIRKMMRYPQQVFNEIKRKAR